jgi:hypothetical protein
MLRNKYTSKENIFNPRSSICKMPPRPESHKQNGYRKSTHPQIDEDYHAGRPLKLNAYYGKDLARIIWQQYSNGIMRRLSDAQKAMLKAPVPRCRSKAALQTLLDEWMKLFDRAFFFEGVRRRWPKVALVHLGKGVHGVYEHKGRGVCINLDTQGSREYKGSVEEFRICTLVHEMLHAFVALYTCMERSDGCNVKWHPSMGGEGASGHGPAWANAMIAIQPALQREVRWPVDCAVEISVAYTMSYTGWKPRADQLVRWGMSRMSESARWLLTRDGRKWILAGSR